MIRTLKLLNYSNDQNLAKRYKKVQSDKSHEWHLKGLEFYHERKYNDAIASFTRALYLNQSDSSIYYHRAEALIEIMEFESALRNYRQCLLLQKFHSNFVVRRMGQVLYTWGNILLDCNRFVEAIECFDEAIIFGVSEFECNLKRAFALTGLKEYEGALTYLYELTEFKPDCADLYIFRAEIHKHLGNVDFANLDMIKASDLNPIHPNLDDILDWIISICVNFKNKADYEILKSNYTQAIGFLSKAIDLDSKDLSLLIKRGNAFKNLGEWENSIQDYLTVLSNSDRDQVWDIMIKENIGDIYLNLAIPNYKLNKYSDAIQDLNTCLFYSPKNFKALNLRSECFLKISKFNECIIDSQNALKLIPDDKSSFRLLSSAYLSIGLLNSKNGEFKDAIANFSNAIQYNDQNTKAFINRAKAYHQIQEIDNARQDISIALTLDPSNLEAASVQTLLQSSNLKTDFPKRKKIIKTVPE